MTTIGNILRNYNNLCQDKIINRNISRDDYEYLLAATLNKTKQYLYINLEQQLNVSQQQSWLNNQQRYLNGEPIAYILGYSEFYGLKLKINNNVLVPRLDTELLVQVTSERLRLWLDLNAKHHIYVNYKLHIADLGTGSGAIALALAHTHPEIQLHACDKNILALNLAKQNAINLNIQNIIFYHGTWFSALPTSQQYAIIVSNPPYIAVNDYNLDQNVKTYEPHDALFADDNGLQDIKHIISQASIRLLNYGYLIIEHGWQQKASVQKLMQQNNFSNITTLRDFSNHERVTCGQKIV